MSVLQEIFSVLKALEQPTRGELRILAVDVHKQVSAGAPFETYQLFDHSSRSRVTLTSHEWGLFI